MNKEIVDVAFSDDVRHPIKMSPSVPFHDVMVLNFMTSLETVLCGADGSDVFGSA